MGKNKTNKTKKQNKINKTKKSKVVKKDKKKLRTPTLRNFSVDI